MDVRDAEPADIDALARVWHDGWHDAHAQIVPPELTRLRTLENFRQRLENALPGVRVGRPSGAPVGFSLVKENELYQLYVPSRGSGVAADAEARLAERGFTTAWLACAIEANVRAARF
ncbi:MAG TPA: hypothetical protein VFO14_10310 [Vicinamibacterales bacterium]|nr:hypothetical protein [Vicinamibacterales bacterium]